MPSAIPWVNRACSVPGSINKGGKEQKEQEPECSLTSVCDSCKMTADITHVIFILT